MIRPSLLGPLCVFGALIALQSQSPPVGGADDAPTADQKSRRFEWPQYKGNVGQTGVSPDDAPTRPPVKYPTMDDVPRFTPKTIGAGLVAMSAPLATGDRLVIATRDGWLNLADHSGKVLDQHELGSKAHAPPIAAGGFVLVATDGGRLRAFQSR